jgi:hypothetical protein
VIKEVVAVHWRDIHFHDDWRDDAELHTDLPVFITYGVKVKGGDPLVVASVVAPDSPERRYGDVTKIPKGCIVKVEKLGTVEVQK